MPNYSQHVQFRLDERHGKLLADRAAVAGVSANLIARRILEERLDKNEDAILHGLNFLAEALSTLATRIDKLTEEQTAQGREMNHLRNAIRDEFHQLAAVINGEVPNQERAA